LTVLARDLEAHLQDHLRTDPRELGRILGTEGAGSGNAHAGGGEKRNEHGILPVEVRRHEVDALEPRMLERRTHRNRGADDRRLDQIGERVHRFRIAFRSREKSRRRTPVEHDIDAVLYERRDGSDLRTIRRDFRFHGRIVRRHYQYRALGRIDHRRAP
jgi:hypothetical protein